MTADGPDLVVAGAGGGLVGALRAAQHGLDVLVVETNEHFRRGNNTSMSTAMVPGAGTRWQREAGIDDSPDLLVEDIVAKTKGQADRRLAATLAAVSAELVEWLADDVGLPLSLVTDFHYPGHSVDRCHTIPGRHGNGLIDHLVRAVKAGGVEMLVPARLVDIGLGIDGHVESAVVRYPDGTDEQIPTTAVLLATNGYGADPDLVAEHLPEIATARYHGSDASRGDALRIGTELGAATAFLDAYQGHAALVPSAGTHAGWATIMHGAVMLDLTGHRFGNETIGYSDYAPKLAARPEATGWIVLDQRIHDLCLAFTDFSDVVRSGCLVWADDLDELVTAIDLPSAAVRELRAAGSVARGEAVDRFGRTSFEAPLSPPYAAVRVAPALFHTQGGLVVDEHARVMQKHGFVIPGLYASGGAAAGMSGHGASGYLAGNGLLPALGLAYLAADHVAGPVVPPLTTRTTSEEGEI